MKVQMTVLALALAACCGTAFAQDDSETNTKTLITNRIHVAGDVDVDGKININSEAAANVDQDQSTIENQSIGDGDHTARMTDNALRNSRGNIGVNVGAGVGNAQSNDASITTLASAGNGGGGGDDDKKGHDDGGSKGSAGALSHAMVFSTQGSFGNYATTHTYGTNYRAVLDGDALRDVQGNVGVNVAAGVGNAQSNGMAASVADAAIAKSSSDSEQLSFYNELQSACGDLDVVARFGDNALQAASGNIGVNVAAGVGNLQHNGLAMAAAGGGN
jgi:hypothetical protein